MQTQMLPTELWIMDANEKRVQGLRPVTSLDIHDGLSSNFHDDGLYSTLIFGRVGTEDRDLSFSYIDVKTTIMHPKMYKDVCALKGLYKGILNGRETARWDKELCDFVAEPGSTGKTGYSFFMDHFNDIVFKVNKSPARSQRIEFVNKYRKLAMTRRVLVIPAGLRDFEVDASGRSTKNEINDLYYTILSIANTISVSDDMNSPALNIARNALTLTFLEIYSMLEMIISGKKGFMLNKWGSRRVTHGTRNVLTVMDTSSAVLGNKNAPAYSSTVMGLFQTIKSLTPLTIFCLRSEYLGNIFSEGESAVPLIDKRSLKQEFITIHPETRSIWTTKEGLLHVINSYITPEARHRPIEIEGRWLALIYKGPDMTFKVFNDIRELPAGFDKKYVTPITLVELLYLSGYKRWNEYYVSTTRYPITGIDSNYPATIYCKTTTIGEVRTELDDRWMPVEDGSQALEFPRADIHTFVDAMSPHSSRLVGLTADFDGDMGSGTSLMTDEAVAENKRFLATRSAWVSANGSLRASANYDTIELTVLNLTGRLDYAKHASIPAVL
jgi:hypothetical protein